MRRWRIFRCPYRSYTQLRCVLPFWHQWGNSIHLTHQHRGPE